MIQSFNNWETESLFNGIRIPRFISIENVARRKLEYLEAARSLKDLSVSRGNHLEKLYGDRLGQMSIRINDQWRICFEWTSAGPADVEIVDYH